MLSKTELPDLCPNQNEHVFQRKQQFGSSVTTIFKGSTFAYFSPDQNSYLICSHCHAYHVTSMQHDQHLTSLSCNQHVYQHGNRTLNFCKNWNSLCLPFMLLLSSCLMVTGLLFQMLFFDHKAKTNICIISEGLLPWLWLVQIYFWAGISPLMQEGNKVLIFISCLPDLVLKPWFCIWTTISVARLKRFISFCGQDIRLLKLVLWVFAEPVLLSGSQCHP